jgi:hypothetical protein
MVSPDELSVWGNRLYVELPGKSCGAMHRCVSPLLRCAHSKQSGSIRIFRYSNLVPKFFYLPKG